MKIPETTKSELIKRLHRANGQVKAVEKMVEDERDCTEIVTQITAATKALDSARSFIIVSGIDHCVQSGKTTSASSKALASFKKMIEKL